MAQGVSNPNGRKGSSAESAVLEYFKRRGFKWVYRMRQQGAKDRGDIGNIEDVVIEVKAQREYTLATWMKEVAVEKANAEAQIGALVMKPKGIGTINVSQWWVLLTLEDLTKLLIESGFGPHEDLE